MLSSISPVGETARRQRWSITAIAYLVASTLGGMVVGTVAGGSGVLVGASAWPMATRLALLAVALFVGAGVDAGRLPVALPTWRRQVDERWLSTYRGWVYGAGYGFQLGLGVVTIVTSAITYATLLAAMLVGSWGGGVTIGATFGLVRALPLLTQGRVRTPAALRARHRTLSGVRGRVQTAATVAQVLLGVGAVTLIVVR